MFILIASSVTGKVSMKGHLFDALHIAVTEYDDIVVHLVSVV